MTPDPLADAIEARLNAALDDLERGGISVPFESRGMATGPGGPVRDMAAPIYRLTVADVARIAALVARTDLRDER